MASLEEKAETPDGVRPLELFLGQCRRTKSGRGLGHGGSNGTAGGLDGCRARGLAIVATDGQADRGSHNNEAQELLHFNNPFVIGWVKNNPHIVVYVSQACSTSISGLVAALFLVFLRRNHG